MVDRNRSFPLDLEPMAEAVDVAIRREDMEAAKILVEKCLSQFKAISRTEEESERYIAWLQNTISMVRVAREHVAKRLGESAPSYSNAVHRRERILGASWLAVIPLLLVLWPAGALSGDLQSAMDKQAAAAKRQRAATQTAAPADGFFQTQWVVDQAPPPPAASNPAPEDCAALPAGDLQAMISRMSLGSVSPKLVNAVISQESGGKPCAVSRKGAMGLMQIMPELAADFKVDDPFDPEQNMRAGVRYLAQLSDKYRGDLRLVLAAYNAGPARVDAAGGVPEIAETQDYVRRIMSKVE